MLALLQQSYQGWAISGPPWGLVPDVSHGNYAVAGGI